MDLQNNKTLINEYRIFAKKLVQQMTLDEKISQTIYQSPAIERLNIPAYNWWNEALHGVARAGTATVFPQAIGLAATFDEEFMEEIGEAVSEEARGKFNIQQKYQDSNQYKGLTFWAPNINIFRDPRWGRGHETFGEDPYLTSRLGVGYIKGLQGKDERYLKTAACVKHFAVHSGPEGTRHSFDAKVGLRDLYETYLPAFKACIQEGKVEAVMGAYNRINGEPCCGSRVLLQNILREQFEFEGHVVSDCGAIQDFHAFHHVTSAGYESAALAMNNGCDLNCGCVFACLKKASEKGVLDENRLDEAVTNLLTTRIKLGLIKLPDQEKSRFDDIPYQAVDSSEHRELNKDAARRSIVLLKNQDHILPLDKTKIKTIGIIGPNADSRNSLTGNYEGTSSHYWTVLEGIQDYVKDDVRVVYSQGCHLWKNHTVALTEDNNLRAEVNAVCEESDIIIACMGLDATIEGEEGDAWSDSVSLNGDKPDLHLPGLQQDLLKEIAASEKPVILLLLSGSALAIDWAQDHIQGILQCWYPGAEGGKAIARILFGEYCPEGKLPITFYKESYALPDFSDYRMEGRTYRYMKEEALYPFGFGLSYTSFQYKKIASAVEKGEAVFRFKVKNTGAFKARETVQVYVKIPGDHTPNAQLKGIKKVDLMQEQEKELTISLGQEAFGLFNDEGKWEQPSEKALVYIGGQAPDARSEELMGQSVLEYELSLPF